MHIPSLFPMMTATAAVIFTMICLFAGSKPGFMETYSLLTLNTSMIGHNLAPAAVVTSALGSSTLSNASAFGRDLGTVNGYVVDDDTTRETREVTDDLGSDLGIKDWYSMHLMNICEGTYTPNATVSGAGLRATACTNMTTMFRFNITDQIIHDLRATNSHLGLSDIHWPSDIQNGLNKLDTALKALFILYATGTAAAGVSIFTSLAASLLHSLRFVIIANWAFVSLSFFAFLPAALISTIVLNKAVNFINKYGNPVGIYAYRGDEYLWFTWCSVSFMALGIGSFYIDYFLNKIVTDREYTEKVASKCWWRKAKDKKDNEASVENKV